MENNPTARADLRALLSRLEGHSVHLREALSGGSLGTATEDGVGTATNLPELELLLAIARSYATLHDRVTGSGSLGTTPSQRAALLRDLEIGL